MTDKRFTRQEINKIIYEQFKTFYTVWSNDMTLSEKLLLQKVQKDILSGVVCKLNELEKGDDIWMKKRNMFIAMKTGTLLY